MGKKKSKVVDLKAKPSKVSNEHLTQLQQAVNAVNGIQFEVGKIEAQKHAYLHKLTIAQDGIKDLQQMLVKEYGTFDVNLQTGELNNSSDDK